MGDIEINDLSNYGVIRDLEGYMLPPEVFTLGENVRVSDGGIEALTGRTQIFGVAGNVPHFLMPVVNNASVYWLYTALANAYVYDGASHTDITRATGLYSASETREWNGTLLGGLPILNNGTDIPQVWSAMSVGQRLIDLPNWPLTDRTKVIRAFKSFLIALNVSKGGTQYPHMVKWSNPADPGAVPTSWDQSDTEIETGENDLDDVSAGVIVDGLPLKGQFFVYKEASIWRLIYAGGQNVFNFDTLSETAGAMATRCVGVTGDGTRHFVKTHDDLLVHDGRNMDSIVDRRYKRFLANAIDTNYFQNSFVFCHPSKDEMWFCYPESGVRYPNRALIWNYREAKAGVFTEAEVNFRNAAVGTVETSNNVPWASDIGNWDAAVGPWGEISRRKTVVAGTVANKFFVLDTGLTNDGAVINSVLRREGLAVIGKKRDGSPIVDVKRRKLVTRVWIKAEGNPFSVRLGNAPYPEGSVTWTGSKTFTPGTDRYVDLITNGVLIAIEFSGTSYFKIFGYRPEFSVVVGNF